MRLTKELLHSVLFDGCKYPDGLKLHTAIYDRENRTISVWLGEVTTIHGQKTAVIEGDWIITEPNGVNHYPCKPDIFRETYELINNSK